MKRQSVSQSVMNGHEPAWIGDLEAFITKRQGELEQLRTTLAAVRGMFTHNGTPAVNGTEAVQVEAGSARKPRRAAVTAGSLTDRVLSLVRDAGADRINMPALVKQAKAPASAVRKEVKAMVAAGRLTQLGFGRHTKYELRS